MIKIFNKESLSSSIITILILVSLIPTTTLIAFDSTYKIEYLILMYLYWLLLLTANINLPIIVINKGQIKGFKNAYKYITIILCTTVIFVSWKFTGLRFHFGLLDVYDLRAEARGYEVSLIVGYLSTF
jgi:hypothetical protein